MKNRSVHHEYAPCWRHPGVCRARKTGFRTLAAQCFRTVRLHVEVFHDALREGASFDPAAFSCLVQKIGPDKVEDSGGMKMPTWGGPPAIMCGVSVGNGKIISKTQSITGKLDDE